MPAKITRLIFNNSVHTSNPCGLPRLSFTCFHAITISDMDTLVALTSVGAALGSVWREVEIINHNGSELCLSEVLLFSPSFCNEVKRRSFWISILWSVLIKSYQQEMTNLGRRAEMMFILGLTRTFLEKLNCLA